MPGVVAPCANGEVDGDPSTLLGEAKEGESNGAGRAPSCGGDMRGMGNDDVYDCGEEAGNPRDRTEVVGLGLLLPQAGLAIPLRTSGAVGAGEMMVIAASSSSASIAL